MTRKLYILVDQVPVAVDPAEWQEWMDNHDRVLCHFESHTPSRVWTLTTFFLGVEKLDTTGKPHLFATVYLSGPDKQNLTEKTPRRLAATYEVAMASHKLVLEKIRARTLRPHG